MRLIKAFLLTCIVAITLLITASCETWRQGCEGNIIVANSIPDTTIYLNGEPFYRDLFGSPPVLSHTEGKTIAITVLADDESIADAKSTRSHVSLLQQPSFLTKFSTITAYLQLLI